MISSIFLLRVRLIHLHFLRKIPCWIIFRLVLLHKFSLRMRSGQKIRCRLCRAICPGASLARASARIRRDRRYQKSGRVSAPALITARRRSYFTPRSSIIHAVNNAPLFRVTLYQVSFLPSFLSPFLSPALPSFSPSPSCRVEMRESPKSLTRRDEVGVHAVSGRDTLISRFIHRNGDTLRSVRSRRA